ncbi:MAG: PqiC family protein, partial [Burkholderiales bacterium]
MSSRIRACAVAMLISLFSACGSPPKEHFYTLTDSAGSEPGALPILDYSVAVGPVFVPDAVDRPQFVLRMPGSEVRIAEQVRWAEPLKEGIARAVAATLAHSLD